MKRTMRWAGLCLLFLLCLGVLRVHAQQRARAQEQSQGQARQPVGADPELPHSWPDPGAMQNVVVPRLVKFNGVAKDLMGHPTSGVVGLTFAIYKEQEGGAALWLETQNAQVDEQGRYAVLLGATKNEGLPVELFAAAEPRWLGVQVNLPGEVEQPRVLLVSVPYALKAADAENLGGRPASSYVLATGDVATSPDSGGGGGSAGTKSAGEKKTAKAAATAASVTANFIPVFTDNAGTLGNSVMTQNGTSVGILQGPTSNPTVQLDVNGGIRGTGLATGGRNTTPDAINTNSLFLNGSNAMAVIGASNAAFAPGVLFTKLSFFAGNGTATAERMTIDGTAGNVGIGTTTPTAKLDVNGSLNLPSTVSASVGVISLGGSPFIHNFGNANTFVGQSAGNTRASLTGGFNTAAGSSALSADTTGSNISAFGASALQNNTTGFDNSAFGSSALGSNTTGDTNSAFGVAASLSNTTGTQNAAFGNAALEFNTTGTQNAAFGAFALQNNTVTGNSAFGFKALAANTSGTGNTAVGSGALGANTTGQGNSAFGAGALVSNTTGNFNIAVGLGAGNNLSSAESSDIDIGNGGIAGESNTIRIGSGQTSTFIAGISGATSSSGIAVFVNSSGLLGTTTSSRRFKHAIADMGTESDLLMNLRPVSFYYKQELDETQTRQYGLVAEEVAQVAPDLVVFDKDGQPQTVRYHFVNAMLLNEVQKQRRTIQQQQAEIEDLATRLAKLEALITAKL